MSKMEDFENAPFGATATHDNGSRAMKTDKVGRSWILQNKIYLDDEEMAHWNYTLDPSVSAPTTVHEALALAWELAHEVEKGQSIPSGTEYLLRHGPGYLLEVAHGARRIDVIDAENIRTLDPCLDPVPDWYDAPAVLAWRRWDDVRREKVWSKADECYKSTDGDIIDWTDLCDVTPLYPKGQDA